MIHSLGFNNPKKGESNAYIDSVSRAACIGRFVIGSDCDQSRADIHGDTTASCPLRGAGGGITVRLCTPAKDVLP